MCLADLAQHLAFFLSIIPHEIVNRSITYGAGTVFRNITFHTSEYRSDGFVVSLLVVRNKISPVPILLIGNDFWKFINLEFLILGRMGIVESPLFEWDVSTDKVN